MLARSGVQRSLANRNDGLQHEEWDEAKEMLTGRMRRLGSRAGRRRPWKIARGDRTQQGKIDLVGFLLLVVLAFGIYAALMFVPVYVDNFYVSHAVAIGCNIASKGFSDNKVRSEIRDRLRSGGEDAVPSLNLTDDQIVIERDEAGHTVSVQVDYARSVKLNPSDRIVSLTFHLRKDCSPHP
jgi:hypothetical protein